MNFQLDAAWEKLQSIWQGFIAFLPNLAFGLIVYFIVYLLALAVGRGVGRVRDALWTAPTHRQERSATRSDRWRLE